MRAALGPASLPACLHFCSLHRSAIRPNRLQQLFIEPSIAGNSRTRDRVFANLLEEAEVADGVRGLQKAKYLQQVQQIGVKNDLGVETVWITLMGAAREQREGR